MIISDSFIVEAAKETQIEYFALYFLAWIPMVDFQKFLVAFPNLPVLSAFGCLLAQILDCPNAQMAQNIRTVYLV